MVTAVTEPFRALSDFAVKYCSMNAFLSFKLGLAAEHCASLAQLADPLLENSDPTEQSRDSISCGYIIFGIHFLIPLVDLHSKLHKYHLRKGVERQDNEMFIDH